MKRILLLPLDERPCNYDFPALLLAGTDIELLRPPKSLLGQKKTSGDTDGLWEWLHAAAPKCDGAVISIDTLVYSGILPSRLHHTPEEELLARCERLCTLREENPCLPLFGFSLIMRNPQYSSSDEEPDYYEQWGCEIHRRGVIRHKKELSIATPEEAEELASIDARLPAKVWEDYVSRREKNIRVNLRAIELAAAGVLDFLIIPQDDSSPYGLTAKDQQTVRRQIREQSVQLKCYMYPDADAVGNTLCCRMALQFAGQKPLVYVRYANQKSAGIIPPFEDRTVNETIDWQLLAAGALRASSMEEAGLLLCVNPPSGSPVGHDPFHPLPVLREYDADRNQIALIEYARHVMEQEQKPAAFADIAYANGGDPALFSLLRESGLLWRLAGYAGWNTSSNTLGTAIPMALLYLLYGPREEHLRFLASRYLEDVGYMSAVRSEFCQTELAPHGWDYFKLDGEHGEASRMIGERLQRWADENLSGGEHPVRLADCRQPWNRMFETAFTLF